MIKNAVVQGKKEEPRLKETKSKTIKEKLTLADKCRIARTKREMSQYEFANIAGCSQATICKIEKGFKNTRKNLSKRIDTLYKTTM